VDAGDFNELHLFDAEDELTYMLYADPKSKKDDTLAGGSIEATETID